MNDDRGNFSGGYNPPNPMAMFAEQWMTAMRMWAQALSSYAPGMWQQPGNPFPFGGVATPAVSVQVSATSPVEVTLSLCPGSDLGGLLSEPLRAEEFMAPAIEPASVIRDPGGVRVSLKIGAEQPKGRYRGLIRKEIDKSVAGELTVIVS